MTTPARDGLLLVDKPEGVTSHDVIGVARRALGMRRIGHTGTLDPFATGLLVLLVGRATRVLPYIDSEPKVYEATIRFGAETETDDATGAVVREAPCPPREAVERGMAALTGLIEQQPPAYSAKKVAGRRAYAAARRGETVTLAPVQVRVDAWAVRAWHDGAVDVTVTCGTGTYVRALARDLGRLAGSAAHLTALRRVRSGPFTVAEAVPLEALRRGVAPLRPVRDALASLPVEVVAATALARLGRGQDVPASVPGPRAVLASPAGEVVAIGERRGAMWHPRVVLSDA
jgi:tRNA pseudouridine55 synthase